MMMMVVLIFIVCWLPYHTYFITANINPEINYSHYIQEIYLMIYWLAMSNSMYNPMIYCYMNQRFIRIFSSCVAAVTNVSDFAKDLKKSSALSCGGRVQILVQKLSLKGLRYQR